jgi:hypothetical protein
MASNGRERAVQALIHAVAALGVDLDTTADVLLAVQYRNDRTIALMTSAMDAHLDEMGLKPDERAVVARLAFDRLVGITAAELTPAGREAVAHG